MLERARRILRSLRIVLVEKHHSPNFLRNLDRTAKHRYLLATRFATRYFRADTAVLKLATMANVDSALKRWSYYVAVERRSQPVYAHRAMRLSLRSACEAAEWHLTAEDTSAPKNAVPERLRRRNAWHRRNVCALSPPHQAFRRTLDSSQSTFVLGLAVDSSNVGSIIARCFATEVPVGLV